MFLLGLHVHRMQFGVDQASSRLKNVIVALEDYGVGP